MIIQPTFEQARHVNRKRAYSGPGFGPRSFVCAGMGLGIGLGLSASSGGAPTPASIMGADTLQWCRADQGVTATDWNDISGQGKHYTQATGSAFPTFGATAGPNSTPALTFDGTDDVLNCAGLSLPAPGTTPTWIWVVMKQTAWVSTRRIFSATNNSNICTAFANTGTPTLAIFNGATVNDNAGATVGTWVAAQFYFSNSTSDFIQINDAAKATGASAGNNSSGVGRTLGAGAAGFFSSLAVADILYARVLPSAGQITQFAAYRLARYAF
jgi:hypothetical protein